MSFLRSVFSHCNIAHTSHHCKLKTAHSRPFLLLRRRLKFGLLALPLLPAAKSNGAAVGSLVAIVAAETERCEGGVASSPSTAGDLWRGGLLDNSCGADCNSTYERRLRRPLLLHRGVGLATVVATVVVLVISITIDIVIILPFWFWGVIVPRHRDGHVKFAVGGGNIGNLENSSIVVVVVAVGVSGRGGHVRSEVTLRHRDDSRGRNSCRR